MTADVPTAVHVTPKTLRRVEVGEHAPQESFRHDGTRSILVCTSAGTQVRLNQLGMAIQPRCLG